MQLTHVLLKVKIATETLAAQVTGEGFGVVVRVHVKGEIVNLVKGLLTDDTLVLLLGRMCKAMVLVVAFLMEAFTAVFTHEWLVSLDTQVIQSFSCCQYAMNKN